MNSASEQIFLLSWCTGIVHLSSIIYTVPKRQLSCNDCTINKSPLTFPNGQVKLKVPCKKREDLQDGFPFNTVQQMSYSIVHAVSSTWYSTLQRKNTENSKQIFPEKELRGHSPNFHIHASVSVSYIPLIGLPILLQENMWTDPGNIHTVNDSIINTDCFTAWDTQKYWEKETLDQFHVSLLVNMCKPLNLT